MNAYGVLGGKDVAPLSLYEPKVMRRIKGLDGIRGIAISLVLIQHLFFSYFEYMLGPSRSGLGGIGVTIFFVLSGFLISSILFSYKNRFDNKTSLKIFYIRRSIRIFPLYYLVIIIGKVFGWNGFGEEAIYHALYITNFHAAYLNAWQGPADVFWSLSVEEQFYLIWPAMVLMAPGRSIIQVIIISILFGFMVGPIMYSLGFTGLALYVTPFTHLHELGMGSIVAYFYINERDRIISIKIHDKTLSVLLFGMFFMHAANTYGAYSGFIAYLVNVMYALLTSYLIICCISNQKATIVRLLELPPLRYLGRISYGIYLFHNFVRYIYEGTTYSNHEIHTFTTFTVHILTTLILASLTYEFFEKPISTLKRFVRVIEDPVSKPF